MNFIFVTLVAFLKSHRARMFLFLVVLLGILLSFMHNGHLAHKTNINKNFSKVNNSNKLSKPIFSTEIGGIKDSYIKYKRKIIPERYIISGLKEDAKNENNLVDTILISKNYDRFLNSKTYNMKDIKKDIKLNASNASVPGFPGITTGGAIPVPIPFPYSTFYNTLTSFVPLSVVAPEVSASSKTSRSPTPSPSPPPPPPPPPPKPVPEPSSIILGLIGLSGILGFRKNLLR
jgi:hypothetical protein